MTKDVTEKRQLAPLVTPLSCRPETADKQDTDSSSMSNDCSPTAPTCPSRRTLSGLSQSTVPKPSMKVVKTYRPVGVLEYLTTFLGISDSRDRIMKLLGYTLRLLMWYRVPDSGICMMGATTADEAIKRMSNVEKSLIDARMLLNHFKYLHSVQAIIATLQDKTLGNLEWYAMLTRNMFWTQEVVASDCNYIVKHVLTDFDAARPTWHYKFGKSVQLTILFCVACSKLLRIRRAASERGHTTEKERDQILLTSCTLVRCICDCIIYYTWIDAYKPNKGFTYFCGLISAMTSLYTSVRGHYLTLAVVRKEKDAIDSAATSNENPMTRRS